MFQGRSKDQEWDNVMMKRGRGELNNYYSQLARDEKV